MGFAKLRNRIQTAIKAWHCFGHFGYGHGRAVKQFGDEVVQKRSVCSDICPMSKDCRSTHHEKMDDQYPDLSRLVQAVVEKCQETKTPIVKKVVEAMIAAHEEGIPAAIEVKNKLAQYGIEGMTDHYVCGQFENIQKGLNAVDVRKSNEQ